MLKEKVQKLLKEQGKTMKDLCSFIEITDAGIRKIFNRDSCELSTLYKIAEFFDKKSAYFLNDYEGPELSENEQIQFLKGQITALERMIDRLTRNQSGTLIEEKKAV